MKKTAKKLISVLLVSIMLLTMAPLTGFVGIELPTVDFGKIFTPKSYAATSGTCGENLTWTLTDEGTLIISGTGKMTSSSPWYNNTYIEKVVIENGVTSIGDSAFDSCRSLTEITIPESVTSIGDDAFWNCSSLTEITIPESVTSIGRNAFKICSSLAKVTIPDSVTYINDYTFSGCSSLTEINIPEGVTHIDYGSFGGCRSLAEITIPDSVTYIGQYAFSNCSSLSEINIPESVTYIGGYAFSGCLSVTTVNVDVNNRKYTSDNGVLFTKDKTELLCYPAKKKEVAYIIPDGVTSIYGMAFYKCSSLTEITIPESVTSIGSSAFSGCSSLTEINIPEGVFSIGSSAFSGCSSLTEINIPEGVTSIGSGAFSYCRSLNEITIPEGVTSIYDYSFSYCSSLTEITIPEDVTSIGYSAFRGCSSLTEITIPDSVTSIGNYAFSDCSSLTEITIPDSVTSIGNYAFSDCSSLTEITIPDSVTSIGNYAFYGCSSLTKITIPEGVSSIGQYTFYDCSSISEITIPEGVSSIGDNAFCNCSSLTEIIIPEGVTSIGDYAFRGCNTLAEITIPEGVTSIDQGLFNGCNSLAEITIPEGVTSIGYSAFSGCDSLAEITIPESVTSIGDDAFHNCRSLTEIIIPEGVTSIGYSAFSGCDSLAEITIPESVTSIGIAAFDGCSSLTNVCYSGAEAQWALISIGGFNTELADATIYYNGTMLDKEPIDYPVTGDCSNSITWIIDKEGTLTISGSGTINSSWYPYKNLINKVVISEGITSIGSGAFRGCVLVTEITIPDSVTSIGNHAFEYCTSLTEITIPDSVTSIGGYAFRDCSSLTEITLPKGVTSIGDFAFYECSSLTEITIPERVTSIGRDAFHGCRSLTEIIIPEGVTSIGYSAFSGCNSLVEITIPEGVTSIDSGLFNGCNSLVEITIPEGVTSIDDDAFRYCSSLTEITIPRSVTFIGYRAFDDCNLLYKVNITDIEAWCEIDFEGAGTNPLCDGGFLYLNGEKQLSISVPGTVTEIKPYAFNGCRFVSLYIPSGVTKIGIGAFYNSDHLAYVYYGGTDEQWKEISIDAYYEPPLNYATVYFAEADDGGSEGGGDDGEEGYIFDSGKCGDNLFWKVTNDMTLKIWGSGRMYDYLSDSAAPWTSYRSLMGKIIIEYGAENIGDAAFRKCNMFDVIYIPTSVKDIGDSSFSGCNSLTDVYFGGTEEQWNKITIGIDNEPLLNATIHFNTPYDGSCDCGPLCDMTATVIKEATCTENGETLYQCKKNSEHTARSKYLPRALGHKLDDGTVIIEATCTAEGSILYKCTRKGCSYSDTETLPKKKHTVKVTKGYSATCEDYGLTDKKECSVCGTVISEAKSISPLGHRLSEKITTAPTCVTTGIKTIYCTRTGCSYSTTETVPALGHNPEREEVLTPSTCTETGLIRKHCTNDNCTYYADEITQMLGHSTVRVTEKENTCLETGIDVITCQRENCSYSVREVTPVLGHNPVTVPGFAVDCESDGLSDGSKCSRCDKVFTEQIRIPASGHSWDKGTVTKEPTCKETGIITYTCRNNSSHTYTEEIPKAHVEAEIKAVEPTCDEIGYTSGTKCSVCKEILVSPTEIPATGHDWNSGYITTKPTCTENGVKTFTCKNNSEHKYTEVVPATGHSEKVLEGYDATCLSDGLTDGVGCENCEAVFTAQIAIPATGHSWDEGRVSVKPTCSSYGKMLYICRNDSSHKKTENIDNLPHTEAEVKGYEATCTQSGLTDGVKCLVCGEFTTKQQTIEAFGHNYQFDSIITEKTCAVEGVEKYVCQNDSSHIEKRKTGTLPHEWDEGIVTKEATCTQMGEITYTCVGCKKTVIGYIAMKPHSYKETQRVEATCTEDGYYILSCENCSAFRKYSIYSTGHYYGNDDICDICGAKKPHEHEFTSVEVPSTCTSYGYTLKYCECGYSYKHRIKSFSHHSFNNGVVTKEATCYNDGIMTYTCSVCGYSYSEIIEPGHKWSETIIIEASCTVDGLKYKECTDCGKTETETIKAGHKWNEGIVDPEPTCTTHGMLTRKCTVCPVTETTTLSALGHYFVDGICERCGMDLNPKKDPYHPYYSLYFMVDDVYTIYGSRLVDEYGIRLEYNDEAKFRKVGIYLTQEGTSWKRVVACVGDDITSLYAVPYLAYEYEELYSPYTTELINLLPMTKNADGIWTYNDYALTDADLVDRNWNPILNIHDIGYSGDKTRVFDDLDEMIRWLKEDSDCIEHTEKTVKGYASTCTKTGLTDGVICSVCQVMLVEQEVIPLAEHTRETVKGKVATCTETGLSAGIKCSVCGRIIVEQNILPLEEHTPEIVNEKAPEVGVPGYTGDFACSVCGEVLEYGEEIEALEPSDVCDHMCHKSGILRVIWKIINFFQKIVGAGAVCDCGAAHY